MKKVKLFIPLLLIFSLSACLNQTIILQLHNVPFRYVDDSVLMPMNTYVQLRMYDKKQSDEVVDGFDELIWKLSYEVDRYHNFENVVNIKTINDSCGTNKKIYLSDDLFEMLSLGVKLTKLTKGKFNIAMGSIIDLYSPYISSPSSNILPSFPISDEDINNALKAVPSYLQIEKCLVLDETDKSIILNKCNGENVIISSGAIAKGFVMQKAYDYLKAYNYSALLDAGSSTVGTIGKNPMSMNGKWTIAFRNPSFLYNDEILCSVSLNKDYFVSTSSDELQRFMYYDENNNVKMMHHIIDYESGKSNNLLRSVSLVSKNTSLAILDAMSTALFNASSNDEIKSLVNDVEKEFKCNISYIHANTRINGNVENYDEYDLYVSKSFSDLIVGSYSIDAKNVCILDNN